MEESSNRRTLEEDIYWQNFQFARFFLKLTSDFHHQITLPNKFSHYMRTKLPEQIVLKVSRVTWNVNLEKGKDNIVLHGGEWEELVSAYSLKKSDLLLFKYNRRECFEVFLYDGTSSCEKEASYFIKKDDQEKNSDNYEHDICRKTKDKLSRRHITNTPRSRNGNNSAKTACARDLSDKSDDVEDMEASSDEENSISEEVLTPLKKAAATRERELENRGRNVGTLIPHIYDVSAVKGTPQKKPIAIYTLRYESNRRPVTAQEVENAWNKAMEASKLHRNSFVVVMRPSCVYRRFFMTIPAAWKPTNVLRKNQEVTLKIKDKTWVCRVSFNRETNVGFESLGWKDFTRENFLEEHDVCLFYPSSDKNDKNYVLNVRIFRVVSEVVSPTLVCPKDNLSKGHTANTSRNRNRNIPAQTACARDRSDDLEKMKESSDEGTSTSEEVIATPKKDAADRERDSRKRKRSVVKMTTREKRNVIHAVCYESNRRPVTDQEVEDALNKATEASELYTNSFVVVMRPSAVYKRFFMRIPAAWKPMEVFKKNQEVILKVKEKAWVCTVSFSGEVSAGFQCMGWKDFVRDNVLEEHDVCLFVPSDRNEGNYVLDVSIFRVVSEVVPPTVVNS